MCYSTTQYLLILPHPATVAGVSGGKKSTSSGRQIRFTYSLKSTGYVSLINAMSLLLSYRPMCEVETINYSSTVHQFIIVCVLHI